MRCKALLGNINRETEPTNFTFGSRLVLDLRLTKKDRNSPTLKTRFEFLSFRTVP